MTKFTHMLADILIRDETELTLETELRMFPEWDSTARVIFLAAVDREYGRSLKGADVAAAKTVGDLFRLIAPEGK